MTAAVEGGEWSAAGPGRTLPPGKIRYPFYRRLGEPQARSGWVENFVPTGIRSWTVQPVVSCYTNWAIPAHSIYERQLLISKVMKFKCNKRTIWFQHRIFPDNIMVTVSSLVHTMGMLMLSYKQAQGQGSEYSICRKLSLWHFSAVNFNTFKT